MKSPYDIIIRPIITEASHDALQYNKYTFEVAPDANKIEIRQAVEEIFKVRVVKVNTLWRRGKVKRRGRAVGRTPDRKKAIVTLAPGDTIELFPGM
ncbi:MAG: 50S ribosomal protein L23 [Firmicutes bacterium]|nr:50S ribosomal protein L23 [Alicyclobacillaceae bacterium]MCL6497965.1 50S ribosomal protein L23 [Bacillota bacterium]